MVCNEKMPKPVSLLWVVSFISMFLPLLKTRRKKMLASMSYVGIIFQPRPIALFFFLFIVSLLNLQHVESWNAQE